MYQALLTRRYLTTKVMPLLASVAVLLCVGTELIVWSVMGGFLAMLVNSGRALIGDVAISWPNTGFAHYEDLIARLEADDQIEAAAPVIESMGLLNIVGGRIEGVLIKGIEPASYHRVTGYYDTLWWRPVADPLPKDKARQDPRLLPDPKRWPDLAQRARNGEWPTSRELAAPGLDPDRRAALERLARVHDFDRFLAFGQALAWPREEPDAEPRPALVLGIEVVSKYYDRRPEGWIEFDPIYSATPGTEMTLGVLPLDTQGQAVTIDNRPFPVANEFRSGIYEIDSKVVMLPLSTLQRMLKMDSSKRLEGSGVRFPSGDDETAQVRTSGTIPPRVTTVLVRGRGDADADALRERCRAIYASFAAAHSGSVFPPPPNVSIQTWRDRNRTLIAVVEKETALVMFIFGVISLNSVFLVLTIFWSMVSERTRDVGILRALGASRAGVAWIWIRYGLAIGVLGSALGLGAAFLIVRNINEIHDWMGRAIGIQIWEPQMYYFTQIPSEIVPWKAGVVFLSGIVASAVGALVPAIRAARMHPVRALRFE